MFTFLGLWIVRNVGWAGEVCFIKKNESFTLKNLNFKHKICMSVWINSIYAKSTVSNSATATFWNLENNFFSNVTYSNKYTRVRKHKPGQITLKKQTTNLFRHIPVMTRSWGVWFSHRDRVFVTCPTSTMWQAHFLSALHLLLLTTTSDCDGRARDIIKVLLSQPSTWWYALTLTGLSVNFRQCSCKAAS